MIDIIAPVTAPQIPEPKPPPPPASREPDWIDERILDHMRESEPVKIWSILNLVAEELSPRTRAEGRETRMKLLPRMQRLIDLGMIFRGWGNSVATFKAAISVIPINLKKPGASCALPRLNSSEICTRSCSASSSPASASAGRSLKLPPPAEWPPTAASGPTAR